MQIRNSEERYGLVAVLMHWIVAAVVVGLFALGFWMVELTYYHDWYKRAPDIHRAVGILLFGLVVFRIFWRAASSGPAPLPEHDRWEVLGAHTTHGLLYVLLFVAMFSGYLISTADGSSINVFGWFAVPSLTGQIKGLEDTAGTVHYWSTWAIVVLATLHAAAAIKHHLVDRDRTLKRMFGQ